MNVGWLAYNPYRINVGSIGIRLKNHLNEYISPAYVVFSCKNDLLPDYLFLIFKTSIFNKIIKENTTGSVRQNLTFDTLSKLKIPLPSITEQQRIVDIYYQKIDQAKELEEEVGNLEKSIEEYLFEVLGIENRIENKRKGLKFIRLFEIDRWDLWNKSVQFNKSNHNIVPLKSLVKLKSGNFLPASKMQKGTYNVYGGNGKNGEHNEYFLEGQRLIIGRVGEYCGNVHLVNGKYWITDNAFIVDKISNEVTYEFLEILLKHMNLTQITH